MRQDQGIELLHLMGEVIPGHEPGHQFDGHIGTPASQMASQHLLVGRVGAASNPQRRSSGPQVDDVLDLFVRTHSAEDAGPQGRRARRARRPQLGRQLIAVERMREIGRPVAAGMARVMHDPDIGQPGQQANEPHGERAAPTREVMYGVVVHEIDQPGPHDEQNDGIHHELGQPGQPEPGAAMPFGKGSRFEPVDQHDVARVEETRHAPGQQCAKGQRLHVIPARRHDGLHAVDVLVRVVDEGRHVGLFHDAPVYRRILPRHPPSTGVRCEEAVCRGERASQT